MLLYVLSNDLCLTANSSILALHKLVVTSGGVLRQGTEWSHPTTTILMVTTLHPQGLDLTST